MEVASRAPREPPTAVFSVLLIAAIAVAVLLLMLLVRSPGSGPRLSVGNAVGAACPAGTGIPVCFDVTVTNTGGEAAADVRCVVEAAEGNSATFLTTGRSSVAPGSLAPGTPLELGVAVTTRTDTVLTPAVSCAPG
jgi:hypothetical protein